MFPKFLSKRNIEHVYKTLGTSIIPSQVIPFLGLIMKKSITHNKPISLYASRRKPESQSKSTQKLCGQLESQSISALPKNQVIQPVMMIYISYFFY